MKLARWPFVVALAGGLLGACLLLVGCESKVESDPSLDRLVRAPRLPPSSALKPISADIKATGPLALSFNDHKFELKRAIAVAEGDVIRFVASSSDQLTCDKPTPAEGADWLEFRFDHGPKGDFYTQQGATPVNVGYVIASDPGKTSREIPVTGARAAVTPLTDADPTFKLEMKKVFSNGDPKPPTTMGASGSISFTPCQSAIELFTNGRPYQIDHTQATARFGDVSFPLRSALAFVVDDGKNGAVVQYIGLFEAAEVSCDAAMRSVSDMGGGVAGLQVQTSPVALSASKKYSIPHPIWMDGLDVTRGIEFFQERYLNQHSLRGYIQIDAADLTEDPLYGFIPPDTPLPAATGVSGVLHLEGPDGRVSGTFLAAICKKQ